jgi:hypothetical protein
LDHSSALKKVILLNRHNRQAFLESRYQAISVHALKADMLSDAKMSSLAGKDQVK